MTKTDILSLSFKELEAEILAMGEKKFRAKQLYEWLHKKKVTEFSQCTNLSAQFVAALDEKFCLNNLKIKKSYLNVLIHYTSFGIFFQVFFIKLTGF